MTAITVPVKGATADRFRAYTTGRMTRKPTIDEHIAYAAKGKRFKPRQRLAYNVDHVALEGTVSSGLANFDSKEVVITRVLFLTGAPEEEVCVGAVDVGAAGILEFQLIEPPPLDVPEPVDVEDLA